MIPQKDRNLMSIYFYSWCRNVCNLSNRCMFVQNNMNMTGLDLLDPICTQLTVAGWRTEGCTRTGVWLCLPSLMCWAPYSYMYTNHSETWSLMKPETSPGEPDATVVVISPCLIVHPDWVLPPRRHHIGETDLPIVNTFCSSLGHQSSS